MTRNIDSCFYRVLVITADLKPTAYDHNVHVVARCINDLIVCCKALTVEGGVDETAICQLLENFVEMSAVILLRLVKGWFAPSLAANEVSLGLLFRAKEERRPSSQRRVVHSCFSRSGTIVAVLKGLPLTRCV